MNVLSQKDLFRISALFLILLTVFLAIAFLWKWMDIPKTPDPAIWKEFPKEEVWRKFFSISIPLVYGLYTLAYTILSKLIPSSHEPSAKKEDIAELYRFCRYDFLTYNLLPLFLLMLIFWRYLWDWYLFFGIFYLTVVFIKTAILSNAIYQWIVSIEDKNITPTVTVRDKTFSPHIRWGLFLTSLLLYASVSLWINYSVSTTGDEPHYLLITHSLLHDRDYDLKNNIEQEDYKRFSWVKYPMHNLVEKDGRLYSSTYNSLLCLLILPGYALGSLLPDYVLGGRLGALFTINLITSWLLLELFLFTSKISKSPRTAFISWALVGFTSPLFFFSAQIYPEIVGAFVLLFTLIRLLNPNFKWKGLLTVFSAITLISLKMRFAPIALTLPVLWAFTSDQRKRSLRVLVLIGIVGIGIIALLIDRTLLDGLLIYRRYGNVERILYRFTPKWENFSAVFGLIFDQEFGLLFYSPLYFFGLIGIPYLLYRYRREALVITLPILIYTLAVIGYQTYWWYGGWSLPSRYLVIIAPLMGFMAGIILNERRGFIITLINRSLWIWSISIVFILSLVTLWRYNLANGASILLRQIEDLFSTRIVRFFPSFISPSQEGLILFTVLLIFLIMSSLLILKQKPLSISPNLTSSSVIASRKRGNLMVMTNSGLKSFVGAIVFFLLLGGLIIILGRSLPTKKLEAENMRHNAGIQYRDRTKNVWVLREKGVIWDYVILPKNKAVFINILAAGQCNTGEAPHMVVSIGEKVIGDTDIIYGKDSWQSSNYIFEAPSMNRGMHPFSIELANGLYDPRNRRYCNLYVDRIEFRYQD